MENNLSKNFTLSELTHSDTAIKYNIPNNPTANQIEYLRALCINVLQPIREKWGKPIKITSGYRCPKLNSHPSIKGSQNSQHLCLNGAAAADIDVGTNSENKKLYELIKKMIDNKEIIVDQLLWEKGNSLGPAWVHVSYKSSPTKNRNEILKIA